MEKRQAHAFIRRVTWLSETSPDFRDQLLAKCDLLSFKAGQSVYDAGDEPGGVFGVVEGHIELHLPAHDGGPTLTLVGGPGFWAGDIAAVTGQPRRIAIVAGSDCQLLRFSRAEILRMATNDPVVWRYLALLLARNLRKAINVIDAISRRDPVARVAATLLNLTEDPPQDLRAISASQSDLAALTRLSRSAVNSALKDLQAGGLIQRRYGAIDVNDATALREFVWRPVGEARSDG
jgi:CRP/FNR family transcriptional regulator, cyclic AMP receptor protein